jgi:N-acetyl sugar amidotransferase
MLRYCKRCVMPDSKPDLQFDDQGICSACRNFEQREIIDWAERRKEIDRILDRYRNRDGRHWDCLVPVSGGKDSTYQALRMLQLGMNPLCVTATTCDESTIGAANIENLKRLGVDHVQFSPNPLVRAKLNKIGLLQVGDISWPEHVGIFTIPVRAAVQFRVPLIIWGENSQHEYGGPAGATESRTLDRRWLEEFGGLLGLRVSDLLGMEGLRERDLVPYTYPSDAQLAEVGVTGLFLGYFLPWDGYSNALIAKAHGLTTTSTIVEGSIVDYENLDNYQTGIHDYFKFLKFGFGRATDIACLHIRRGRLLREDGWELVRRHDGRFPSTYLGKPLDKILEPLDMGVEEFVRICDRFTNKKIFKTDARGTLIKDRHGNVTPLAWEQA